MRHFSLALAGVVAGSLALSAQATTTTVETWWSEDFQSTNTYYDANYDGLYALTNGTYSALAKGVWTPGEGDASSIFVGTYSNGCTDVLNLSTEGTDLEFAPAPYAGSATSTNKVVVDADVFFVGSDSEPSNLGSDVQFALFLKVPEEVTASSSNAVMVYVRDTGSNQAVWLELPETNGVEDKSWHHVQVKIDYGQQTKTAQVFIDGNQKGENLTLTLANNADSAEGLSSVSFRGTGAVDNFVGGFEVEAAAITHTFTAAAYVDGSLEPSIEIEEQEGANGDVVTFEIPMEWVDSGTVTSVVTKICVIDIASGVTNEYTAASSFSGLDITDDDGYYYVDVEISGADDATAEYALLEVYYTPTEAPPAPTYTATITLPAGYTLSGVKVNNVVQDPVPSLPMTVNDGDVVEFTYTNADGVAKTATVTIDGANATATAEAFTWADYLGAAVDGAYEIDNLAELKLFQKGIPSSTNEVKLATAGETFKLTADIALDAPWPGIGVQNGKDIYSTAVFNAAAFQGTFDGQNHTISGFQMIGKGDKPEGLDYCGFFNSTYGATIQNLKIAYAGSLFAADTTSSTKESGATFVGVAKNSTLRNLTTVAGTVSCSKGFGGIVGYLTSGTSVDSCTNNLNMTSLANNKCGGIAMITQGGSAVTISNCQNNGTQTTSSSNSEYGAIVGYVGLDTTIANCETTVGRFLKHQTGTVTLQGVNKGDARVLAYHNAATPGLNFATVDGNVATFVADTALAAGNIYKVMGPSATATYEFAAAGSISFDTNLVQAVTFNITVAQGLKDPPTETTANGVVTFTARALATPTVTVNGGANATAAWTVNGTPAAEAPATLTEGDTYEVVYTADPGYEFAAGAVTNASGTAGTENIEITISDAVASAPSVVEIAPEDLGATAYASQADAQAAAAGVTVGASAAVEAALDSTELAAYKAMFEIKPVQDNGEWKLTAALTDTAEAALTTEATDDAGDLVTAGFTGNVEIDATPGFYYSIVWGTGVTNLGNETTRVLAEGEKVTLPMPANSANSGFYKVKISVKPE